MSSAEIVFSVVGLFLGMVFLTEAGRYFGQAWIHKNGKSDDVSFVTLDGSIFGLMGLLIAFTFSAAAYRFETRRQLAVEEVNDIGTAWRRLDLLPAARQPALREDFRRYVDSRISAYGNIADADSFNRALSGSQALQDKIWSGAVVACDEASSVAVTTLVLSSLNAMIDITTTRTVAAQTRLPRLIQILLFALSLICALLAGLDSASVRRRSLVRTVGFCLMLAATIFVILDLDSPRVGLIRLDAYDQGLAELRNSMHSLR